LQGNFGECRSEWFKFEARKIVALVGSVSAAQAAAPC
jgi:hypothetical protein